VARTEDANSPDSFANLWRQLAQSDARFAADEFGLQYAAAAVHFQRAFQRAQCRDTAARCDFEADMGFADSEPKNAIRGFCCGRQQRRDAQRETQWLELGGAECLL